MDSPSAGHRFPRYQIQLPVLQKTAPSANRVEVGWTRDLSEDGLRLTSLSWSTPLVLGLVLADPPH